MQGGKGLYSYSWVDQRNDAYVLQRTRPLKALFRQYAVRGAMQLVEFLMVSRGKIGLIINLVLYKICDCFYYGHGKYIYGFMNTHENKICDFRYQILPILLKGTNLEQRIISRCIGLNILLNSLLYSFTQTQFIMEISNA